MSRFSTIAYIHKKIIIQASTARKLKIVNSARNLEILIIECKKQNKKHDNLIELFKI